MTVASTSLLEIEDSVAFTCHTNCQFFAYSGAFMHSSVCRFRFHDDCVALLSSAEIDRFSSSWKHHGIKTVSGEFRFSLYGIFGHLKHLMILRGLQKFATSLELTRPSRGFCFTVIQDSFSNLRGVDGHIPLSHTLWSQIIRKGDIVIDATCGKGLDSLVLSKLTLSRDSGLLYCIDIQERAIKDTRDRLSREYDEAILSDRIKFIQCDHAVFPSEIESGSVSAIVYNLGYLPGTHKDGTDRIVTRTESTIKSFNAALSLLKLGGVLSVTAYRGQASGPSETEACIAFFSSLGQTNWRVFSHSPINTQKGAILFTACRR